MMHRLLIPLLALAAASVHAAEPTATPAPTPRIDASAPAIKPAPHQERFLELHQSFLDRAKSGPVGLLFLGDSITYQWSKRAPEIWEQYYGKYQPANFGIGGDATQHVLWRIENGELDHIDPKVVVLLLGTNNTASHTAEEILAADTKIVNLIRSKLPKTKVLLLAIFPRGPRHPDKNGVPKDDGVARMAIIDKVNAGLAKLDDGKNVRFLNINSAFLGPDGKIPDAIMPDQLHPNEQGYKLWAEAMQPLLSEMMQDK